MIGEVGCSTRIMDLWFLANELDFSRENMMPLENENDLDTLMTLVQANYKLVWLYTTPNSPDLEGEAWNFSFTQMGVDMRIERIEDIRVELDELQDALNDSEEDREDNEMRSDGEVEEKRSFHRDSSNMDSSDCAKPKKKKRRVPPPNPPYRARKRGRYSMIRGLFKNTEDTPVVIGDDGEEVSEKEQKKKVTEGSNRKASESGKKKGSTVTKKGTQEKKKKATKKINQSKLMQDVNKRANKGHSSGDEEAIRKEEGIGNEEGNGNQEGNGNMEGIGNMEKQNGDYKGKHKIEEDIVNEPSQTEEEKERQLREKKGKQKVEEVDGDLRGTVNDEKKAEVKEGKYQSEEFESKSSESDYDSNEERMAISSCDEDDPDFR